MKLNGTLHLLYPDRWPADYQLTYNLPFEVSSRTSGINEDTEEEVMRDEVPSHAAQAPPGKREAEALRLDPFSGRKDSSALAKREDIDVTVYVNNVCRGEILGGVTEADDCHTTINGAGVLVNSLPDNCAVDVYPEVNCQGTPQLDVGNAALDGCYDSINFSSVLVDCS